VRPQKLERWPLTRGRGPVTQSGARECSQTVSLAPERSSGALPYHCMWLSHYRQTCTEASHFGPCSDYQRVPRSQRQADGPPATSRSTTRRQRVDAWLLSGRPRDDHRRRRRLHSFGVGSRTQFPPLSDEARSEPESTKMIIHRVRAALISAAAVADADAVDRQTDRQRAMACIGMNVEAVN